MVHIASFTKGKIFIRICSYLLKEYNQQQDSAMEYEDRQRLDENPSNNQNADIHDALNSTEEVKKEKTKTPSTGM